MARRTSSRARLRFLVPDGHGGRRLSNGGFVVALIAALGLGLGCVLVLSTQIQQQQTELEELQDQAEQASYHEAALQGEVNELSTTNSLARMAAALGMVPNTNPLIIQMPEGTSHGTPVPMDGTQMPGVVPTGSPPASSAAASPSAGNPEAARDEAQDAQDEGAGRDGEAPQETSPGPGTGQDARAGG